MSNYYLVNTNETHRPEMKNFMIANQCAVAQYSPKEQIDKIEKNDVVFIYQNGVGLIAVGNASGVVEVGDYEGYPKEQHLMRLEQFSLVRPPIDIGTMRQISQDQGKKDIFVARTVQPLDHIVGHKLVELSID